MTDGRGGSPPGSGSGVVILRPTSPSATWSLLLVVPAAAGIVIGVGRGSGSAVVAGLILSAVCAVLVALVVGLNALERFAFEGDRFWYKAFVGWQGPIDLTRLRAAYLVPASSGAKLFLLQDDAGVRVRARTSHGFDTDTVAALNSIQRLRSLAIPANSPALSPVGTATIGRFALASDAVIDHRARALFERAIAEASGRLDPA